MHSAKCSLLDISIISTCTGCSSSGAGYCAGYSAFAALCDLALYKCT